MQVVLVFRVRVGGKQGGVFEGVVNNNTRYSYIGKKITVN